MTFSFGYDIEDIHMHFCVKFGRNWYVISSPILVQRPSTFAERVVMHGPHLRDTRSYLRGRAVPWVTMPVTSSVYKVYFIVLSCILAEKFHFEVRHPPSLS